MGDRGGRPATKRPARSSGGGGGRGGGSRARNVPTKTRPMTQQEREDAALAKALAEMKPITKEGGFQQVPVAKKKSKSKATASGVGGGGGSSGGGFGGRDSRGFGGRDSRGGERRDRGGRDDGSRRGGRVGFSLSMAPPPARLPNQCPPARD